MSTNLTQTKWDVQNYGTDLAITRVDIFRKNGLRWSYVLMIEVEPSERGIDNMGSRAGGAATPAIISARPEPKVTYPLVTIGECISTPYGRYLVEWYSPTDQDNLKLTPAADAQPLFAFQDETATAIAVTAMNEHYPNVTFEAVDDGGTGFWKVYVVSKYSAEPVDSHTMRMFDKELMETYRVACVAARELGKKVKLEERKVEVKLRFPGDGLSWEQRPVATTFEVIKSNEGQWITDLKGGYVITLTAGVKAIAIDEGAVEARWNFQGSDQGHYNFV